LFVVELFARARDGRGAPGAFEDFADDAAGEGAEAALP
jgi:hypothetical protein